MRRADQVGQPFEDTEPQRLNRSCYVTDALLSYDMFTQIKVLI